MSGACFRLAAEGATGAKSRALKRLALLPPAAKAGRVEVPLPWRDREQLKAGLTAQEIDAAIDAAPIVDLPLAGLSAVQRSVKPREVARYIVAPGAQPRVQDESTPQDVPIVIERVGMVGRFVFNGHHRITAAVLMGESHIRARLVKLPRHLSAQGPTEVPSPT